MTLFRMRWREDGTWLKADAYPAAALPNNTTVSLHSSVFGEAHDKAIRYVAIVVQKKLSATVAYVGNKAR